MRPEDNLFRSAVMGGFNREDVTAYLEKLSVQHAGEVEELRRALEEAEAAGEEARERVRALTEEKLERDETVSTLMEQIAALRREREELTEQLSVRDGEVARLRRAGEEQAASASASAAELSSLKAQVTVLAEVQRALAQKSEALNRLELENCDLRARLSALETDAEAYRAVKDRVAGIELEAHQRAQEAEDAAARRAEATRQETERWLAEVRQDYAGVRESMDGALERTRAELSALLEGAERIARRLESGGEALRQTEERYRAQEETSGHEGE